MRLNYYYREPTNVRLIIRAMRTSIELFSGGGGLGLGVERAGFRHVALVEWNKHARQTIAINNERKIYKHHWPMLDEPNARNVDFRQFKGVDFVAGGPPCQPFSNGGVHRGDLDDRNMFPEAIRAVRETEPLAFLFENVKGLARKSFRPYLNYIASQLRRPWAIRGADEEWPAHCRRIDAEPSHGGPEYSVEFKLINCADFGAPQLRERLLFVGFRKDLGIQWTWPNATHSKESLLLRQAHGSTSSPTKPWVTIRDAISMLGEPAMSDDRADFALNQHVYVPGAKSYAGHSGSSLDWPGKTLKAGVHGVPGGENMILLEDGSTRYLTIREAACLQGFPSDYLFSGSWGECMRQIGNAVPVMVGEFFASEIIRQSARR